MRSRRRAQLVDLLLLRTHLVREQAVLLHEFLHVGVGAERSRCQRQAGGHPARRKSGEGFHGGGIRAGRLDDSCLLQAIRPQGDDRRLSGVFGYPPYIVTAARPLARGMNVEGLYAGWRATCPARRRKAPLA